ncbi:MAG: hypothetical protein WKG07_25365 [Hymenobacter sp.]
MPSCQPWPPPCPRASPTPARPTPTPLLCSGPTRPCALRLGAGPAVAAQLTGEYNFPNVAAAAAVGQLF